MSKRANPVTIGLFVAGAFALLAGFLIFLGTGQFLEKRQRFILFFDESINGLTIGSTVKFKGVPIGQVVEILIRAENQPLSSSAIPVIIELDESRLERDLNIGLDISDEDAFAEQIANGLRGRLNTESLITGLLFIELDYIEDAPPPEIVQETFVYMEIPTVPSTTARLTQELNQGLARLGSIDFEGILTTTRELLDNLNRRLEELDVPRVVESFTGATDSVADFLESGRLETLAERLDATLGDISALTESLASEVDGLGGETVTTLNELSSVLARIDQTLERVNQLVDPDSRTVYEMEKLMLKISQAADATRALLEFIERNPRSLITGRSNENGNP